MSAQIHNNFRHLMVIGTATCLSLAGAASGAVIINSSQDVAPNGGAVHETYVPTTLTASSVDLAQGLTATVAGNMDTTYESSAGVGTWTNGSISTVYPEVGPAGNDIDHAAYGAIINGSIATLDLGGLFNLSKIDVFLGWNDSGRDDASFQMLVSADGVTYSPIATYTKGPDNTGVFTTPVTNLHSIVDDGAADIASAVRFVQLIATDTDNGAAGIVEIDVIGTAVPEPSAFALIALGGLVGLARRRRN